MIERFKQATLAKLSSTHDYIASLASEFWLAAQGLYKKYILPRELVCILLMSFFFLFFRNSDLILNPQLWAEDGHNYFADAYNYGLRSMFMTYAGTIQTLPRMIAYLSSNVISLEYVPLFFSLSSILTMLLPVFIIWSDKNILFGKNKTSYLLVFTFLYLLLPMHRETLGSIANTIWYLALAAALVLVRPERKGTRWKWFDFAVLTLAGLTGPYAVVLVLPALYLYLRKRTSIGLIKLLIVLVCAAMQLSSIAMHPYPQQENFKSQIKTSVTEYKRPFQLTGMRFIVEPLMQSEYPQTELAYSDQLYVVGIVVTVLYVLALLRAPPRIKAFLLFTMSLYVISLFRTGNGTLLDFWNMLQISPLGARYILIPFSGWIVALLVLSMQSNGKKSKYFGYVILTTLVIILPLSYHLDRFKERHYGYHVKNFNALETGETYCFPENPDDWEMCLKKK